MKRFECCEVLDSKVLFKNGSFQIIRYWLRGWVQIKDGLFINGLTGKETVVTRSEVIPQHFIKVEEK